MNRRNFTRLLAASLLLVACDKPLQLPTVAQGSTVLAFGDSVTFGTGAGRGQDWPTLLGERTGWQVVNAGIPGDTAEAGKHRLAALLDAHQPRLVIIEIGGNDFLRRRPQAAVKDDLREIIKTVKDFGAQAVLIAVPELSLLALVAKRPSDAAIFAELAKEEQIPLIEDVFSDVLAQAQLRADQIHPNAQGYEALAQSIHLALRQFGLAP